MPATRSAILGSWLLWPSNCRPGLLRRVVFFIVLALDTTAARAQVPASYPTSYVNVIKAARQEGRVVVYSTTDMPAAVGLIRDFERLYPSVSVEYVELNSAELNARFLSENAVHRPSADVLWSSSMDLQIKLANDDYAAAYPSPEVNALPKWAVWRNAAWGTTFEPAVFVYSKKGVPPSEVPHTHGEFIRLLQSHRDRYAGNVASYDIQRSAVGFLFATQDSRIQADFWDLARALGDNAVQLETNTSVMVERIAAGKDLLAYDVIGSYALTRARRDPSIGVVLPKDYTLVMSRIALLSKTAMHPNAGKLWLDYLLSRRGQMVMAERSELFSIRDDVPGEFTAASLREQLGQAYRPITVGPSLLVFLDKSKQQEFMRRWVHEVGMMHH